MNELKIEYLPVDALKPYERNAKLHPAEQIEQIKKSISDYGFNDPIGIWKDEVVEGHGRLIAAKELGMTGVPVVRLDYMTDEQRREYALVHNQTTMNSGFDFSVLDAEIEGLPDFDAVFYGFYPVISPDDFGEDFSLPDGNKSELTQWTFTLHQKQKELIEQAIEDSTFIEADMFGNTNRNGNALYSIVKQWAEQKK